MSKNNTGSLPLRGNPAGNYNDKVKMILRSRLEANIKNVVTTLYSAIKMGFLDKIDNVSGGNVIKKDKDFTYSNLLQIAAKPTIAIKQQQ